MRRISILLLVFFTCFAPAVWLQARPPLGKKVITLGIPGAGTSAVSRAEDSSVPMSAPLAGLRSPSATVPGAADDVPADSNPLIFLPPVIYPADGNFITAADLNGDGKTDIVISGGFIHVLLGNGDGTFTEAGTYGVAPYIISLTIADANGDGIPDLVVPIDGDPAAVAVLYGNGDGTFRWGGSYKTGGLYAWSAAVGDLNGDGFPDLIVAVACGTNCNHGLLSVLLGKGDGTFGAPVTYETGPIASSVAVGDFNKDGHLDVVVANLCNTNNCRYGAHGGLSLFLGNGDGTLQSPFVGGSGGEYGYSLAVADLNGDGNLDVVVANQCNDRKCQQPGTVMVLLGAGDGTFRWGAIYPSGGYKTDNVVIGDVNGDGHPDIVTANPCTFRSEHYYPGVCLPGSAGVLLGNGDGSFQQPVDYFSDPSYKANWVAVGDVNSDGKPDLLTVNGGSYAVLVNNVGAPRSITALTSSVNPVKVNATVTYTAVVSSQSGGNLKGSLIFEDAGIPIATVPLVNNQASFSTSYLGKQRGNHQITAMYPGEFNVVTGSKSTLSEFVLYSSSTTLTSSESPAHVGQSVTFTATVTSRNGSIPNGELVTFSAGKKILGTGTTSSAVATLTTSFSQANTYGIQATYAGDSNFAQSKGYFKQVVIP